MSPSFSQILSLNQFVNQGGQITEIMSVICGSNFIFAEKKSKQIYCTTPRYFVFVFLIL